VRGRHAGQGRRTELCEGRLGGPMAGGLSAAHGVSKHG
jgi:hypothetical protein